MRTDMGVTISGTDNQNDVLAQQGVVYSNLGVVLGNDQSLRNAEDNLSQTQDEIRQRARLMAVESDDALRRGDRESLLEHNEQYTALLKAYVKDFEMNSVNKMGNKQYVFSISMKLLIGIPLFSLGLIGVTMIGLLFGCITALETLPELFAALVSLLGTFMVIPKIITKYLFNKKEEENLVNIINKIQEYDKEIRGRM